MVNKVFEVCDRKWRGVGSISKSGYKLRYEFHEHDAERIFETQEIDTQEPAVCISGLVLKGVKKPHDCPAFGWECTPEHPLGATMVSAEGACAAYHAYGRHLAIAQRVRSQPVVESQRGMNAMNTPAPVESHPRTILRKCGESVEMKEKVFSTNTPGKLKAMPPRWARRFQQGKKLLVMGNGGSLCDALHFSVEFTHPIIEKRPAFPVIPLMTDIATMTAIGKRPDASRIFVESTAIAGRPGDMALVVSTSGKSPNLIYALEEARAREMLTIAWAGKDGGRFPELGGLLFHRAVLQHSSHSGSARDPGACAWDLIHIALGAEDVV